MKQEVILVSPQDEALGVMEKMEAHQNGVLHRAFSVFIFNSHGQMLLQQRAAKKYHGGGLWTNACCSHPYPHENVEAAAGRRLNEELRFTTPLQKIFSFTYRAEVENNLIEHEYDHVFAGEYNGEVKPDVNEVQSYAYYAMEEIELLIGREPDSFTAWFKIAFPQVERWWREKENTKQAAVRE